MQADLLFCILFLYTNTISPIFNFVWFLMLSPFLMFRFAYNFVFCVTNVGCNLEKSSLLGNSQTECTSCCMLLINGLRSISLINHSFCFFFVFVKKKNSVAINVRRSFNDLNNDMVNKVLYIHFSHCLVCPIISVTILTLTQKRNS